MANVEKMILTSTEIYEKSLVIVVRTPKKREIPQRSM
jgi:hypothetical protein